MHFKPTAIPQPWCRKGYGRRAPHCTERVTQEGWKRKKWHESKTIHNLWPKWYDFTSSCFWKLNGSVVTHYRCPPGSSNPRSCAQATNPSPRMTQPLHSLGLWQIRQFRSTPLLLPTSPTKEQTKFTRFWFYLKPGIHNICKPLKTNKQTFSNLMNSKLAFSTRWTKSCLPGTLYPWKISLPCTSIQF